MSSCDLWDCDSKLTMAHIQQNEDSVSLPTSTDLNADLDKDNADSSSTQTGIGK
jgi:hypothetical protein